MKYVPGMWSSKKNIIIGVEIAQGWLAILLHFYVHVYLYLYTHTLLEEIQLPNKRKTYVFENFNSLFLQHDFRLNV
jgi:hypothetical protein